MPLSFLNIPFSPMTAVLVLVAVTSIIFVFMWKNKIWFKNSKVFNSQASCYESAYKLIPDGVVVLNSENNITYLNPSAEKMLGCRLRSVMGRSYKEAFDLLHLESERVLQGIFTGELTNNKELFSCECILEPTMKKEFPISLDIVSLSMQNDSDASSHSLFFFKNITEKQVIEAKLSDLEKYDALTRVFNRKSFEAEVKHLVEGAQKHDSKHVLAYFSVDKFHAVNDAVGSSGGDSLIIKMGDIITNHLNKNSDVIGRVSEDEFAVVFRDSKLATAVNEMQAILKEAEEFEFTSMGKVYPVTMSAGFIIIDSSSTSFSRVISEAKSACKSAMKNGESYLSAYNPEDRGDGEIEGNFEWISILKDAIQNNRFFMHAQPIHPLKKEKYAQPFYHYELLIRLSGENGNPIFPNEFLSVAEYYSMMPAIDRWVVRTVLREVSKIPSQIPLPVFAINLSGQSLNDASFLNFVIQEVKTSGVDPQMLCFEITEQVAVEDLSLVNGFISSLKSLGSKFSLDDFGTGVSSYGYLRSLDVDYLKIDGSFVKNIVDDDVAKAMVQSINYVGHTMNLKVIAEFVENDEILELLRAMGVDYGQGYEILRPIPFDEVLKQHMIVDEHDYLIES